VSATYTKLLHSANVTNRKTAFIGGASMAYSQFVIFAMYGLITWFGGLELSSCRWGARQVVAMFPADVLACKICKQRYMWRTPAWQTCSSLWLQCMA
jgi:hypothetical protein